MTGGASGLGLAQVAALKAAGANVAVIDIDEEVEQQDADVLYLLADVSDRDAVDEAVSRVHGHFGRIDFLVNNAGIRDVYRFDEYPTARWQRMLDVNLTGCFNCSQAVVKYMRKAGGGKIVNIASAAGVLAVEGRSGYGASKAGVMMLTRSIALEHGHESTYCNAIAPGVVETPLTASYFTDDRLRARIVEQTPLRRWAQASEIAAPVVFLCSDAASFIQGTVLHVDGGWLAAKSL